MTIEFLTISLILVVIMVGVILIVQANKTKDLREEITYLKCNIGEELYSSPEFQYRVEEIISRVPKIYRLERMADEVISYKQGCKKTLDKLIKETTDISEYQNNRIKTLEDKIEILINILKINK